MLQLKKISVNLALVVSLAAFAGANSAQAETITLPLPGSTPEIQSIVESIRTDGGPNTDMIKNMMRQTRDMIKEEQAKRLPLMPLFRNTVGNTVRTRVMAETSTRTINGVFMLHLPSLACRSSCCAAQHYCHYQKKRR
ncbi:MAG: hypothetical protein D3914_09560 [Candidatus Electrothrix sp. LOE2]|nr:hypothetical protein [Candidatus Electrothrix sp. LOE2]